LSFIKALLLAQVSVPFAPEQASVVAAEVDALYAYVWLITIFFTVLITALIIYFAIKYRRRQPNEVPRPNAGSLVLEMTWTAIPLVISMTIFIWGASLYFKQYRAPQQAMEVFVVGKQWMWKFQHATGQREINELHVPVGTRVKLTMTTEDVIHSVFIPAFRLKMDVVPGRYSQTWFEATKPGRYYLFCTEYCGLNHSGMGGYIEVMEPAAYQQWLSGGGSLSAAAMGQRLFQDRGCATCHQQSQQGRGPMLLGLFGKQQVLQTGESVTVDEAYIRESILNPQAKLAAGFQPIMPTYQGQLSEDQILQLVAYIRSLGTETGASPEGLPSAATGSAGAAGAGGAGQGARSTSGAPAESLRMNPLAPTSPQGGRPNPQVPAGGGTTGTPSDRPGQQPPPER
jgi:cytochrome c oxidase subunit 2